MLGSSQAVPKFNLYDSSGCMYQVRLLGIIAINWLLRRTSSSRAESQTLLMFEGQSLQASERMSLADMGPLESINLSWTPFCLGFDDATTDWIDEELYLTTDVNMIVGF